MNYKSQSGFNDNLPAYLRQVGTGSQVIYLICICLVVAILVSLPLVKIPVSVTGQGIIRPEEERTEIVPSVSGVVEEIWVSEGLSLIESEPILKIRSKEPAGSMKGDLEELQEVQENIDDIKMLLAIPMKLPRGKRYMQEYEAYSSKLSYLNTLYQKANKECDRNEGLFQHELISEKQFDDLCFEREKTFRDMESFRSEALRLWQEAHNDYLQRKRILETRVRQLEERIHLTTIYAPVSGNLVDMKAIYPGTSVSAGEVIGIVSPDSKLIGEFYLEPKDIAFIHEGQAVRLRLYSFPSQEWGMPAGKIYEISDDFILIDQRPAYRVKCHIDGTGIQLKNGFTGNLKKGMTFQAHCMVAHRSIFQLLWDKTDRWLNPNTRATT
jgi:membrane fusion protein, peptide pheromone/bacteriocin exporter